MLDRYSIVASSQQLEERFSINVPERFNASYNAAPSHILPIVTSDNAEGLSFFYWGTTPDWSKSKPISERLINLRVNQLLERPIALKNLRKRRCIIPADGFYGWKKVGKKTVIPYRFVFKSKSLASFAGVWEEYDNDEGNFFHTFSILTIPANELVQPTSSTMPIIFDVNQEKIWLNQNSSETDLLKLLASSNDYELDCYTISPQINSVENNYPSLLLPTPAADQFGNLTLFD